MSDHTHPVNLITIIWQFDAYTTVDPDRKVGMDQATEIAAMGKLT
jgi:hypothetical protein